MTLVVPKGVLPKNVSDAGVLDEANITIGQFSQPIDNGTLLDHNISKYQKVSLLTEACGIR